MSEAEHHTSERAEDPETGPRRLVRPERRMIAGVCSGIADYLGVDPVLVRVVFAALVLAGGTGVMIYAIGWLVIPKPGNRSLLEETIRSDRVGPRRAAGAALLIFAALVVMADAGWLDGSIWVAAIVIGASVLLLGARDLRGAGLSPAGTTAGAGAPLPAADPTVPMPPAEAPTTPGGESATAEIAEPRRPSLLPYAFGVLLLAGGLLGALATIADVQVPWGPALAVGAAAAGGAALTLARSYRIGGTIVLGLVLAICGLLVAVIDVDLSGGVGERSFAPLTTAELRDYELGAGELDLDLSGLELPAGITAVDARLGAGELLVTVPEEVRVRAHATAGAGDLKLFGRGTDGFDVEDTVLEPGSGRGRLRTLELELDVDFGEIVVERSR